MMLTQAQRIIGSIIQADMAIIERPFGDIAVRAGMKEKDVLDLIRQMKEVGLIRKFGAIVRHREAGFFENSMVVWAVPQDRCEEVGLLLASYPEITHCYERRPAFEGKYNLFSMIHLRDAGTEEKIASISKQTGIYDYRILKSEEEFKKSSMEYFK